MLQEDTLHDVIIAVRISPQVGQLRIAPVEAGCSHALCVFATDQAVDGGHKGELSIVSDCRCGV